MQRTLLLSIAALLVSATGSLAATPPESLAATGLYSDVSSRTIAPGILAYAPRFPLWTDGLEKSRWILVPEGSAIDASVPGVWDFPVGTKIWKEFALGGRPVETRFMERTADGWSFAAYAWSADGAEARLAPPRGTTTFAEVAPGVRHAIPGQFECTSCHRGQLQPVLGFGAVQLATGSLEPGAPDLAELSRAGVLVGVPPHLLRPPERPDPTTSSRALGYLHGNCGHCHNPEGPLASLGLDLRLDADDPDALPGALTSAVGRPASTSARAAAAARRIDPGAPERSQLLQRVGTRDPLAQMPPLGTRLVDPQGVDLLTAWIRDELAAQAAVPGR